MSAIGADQNISSGRLGLVAKFDTQLGALDVTYITARLLTGHVGASEISLPSSYGLKRKSSETVTRWRWVVGGQSAVAGLGGIQRGDFRRCRQKSQGVLSCCTTLLSNPETLT